jgi:hypothetical protein
VISATSFGSTQWTRERTGGDPKRVLRGGRTLRGDVVRAKGPSPARLAAVRSYGAFCGSPLWRFISFKAPLVAGTSVLPVPKYAFAGPGGVLPLLTSLLAPLGLPLPPLDMPVAPPPAAYAKLGIKINATVAKGLSFIAFSTFWRCLEISDNVPTEEMFLAPGESCEGMNGGRAGSRCEGPSESYSGVIIRVARGEGRRYRRDWPGRPFCCRIVTDVTAPRETEC